MDMELFFGIMEIDITVIGKMAKLMGREQNYGKMEESILELLKMTNCMVKEVFTILMAKNMKVNL